MRYLNKINSDARQRFTLTGNGGESIIMTLRYMPTQEAWFADFEHEGRSIKGVKVVSSVNILRKYRNLISYGIQCETVSGRDPSFIDDFLTQEASLYLLSADEVETFERLVYE